MTISDTAPIRAQGENLADLVQRTDLYQLVERYTGSGKAHGHTVTYSCPNSNHPDFHPSFTVATINGKQTAKCFSQCEWQGDALDLVKWLEGLSTGEAAQWLRRYLGEPDKGFFGTRKVTPRSIKPLSFLQNEGQRLPADKAAQVMKDYLDSRSWPQEVAETFSLEVVLDSGGSPRIRHPYFAPNHLGEWGVTYFQDRAINESQVKWLSPKGSTPALFNLRALEADGIEAVLVCEGAADAISATLSLTDMPEIAVLACAGVGAWRSEWAEYFSGLAVIVCADNDEAGKRLEEAVLSSVARRVVFARPSTNDLTDLWKSEGEWGVKCLIGEAFDRALNIGGVA